MKRTQVSRLAPLVGSVGLSVAVLLGSVGAALRLPALGVIWGQSDGTSLDYRHSGPGSFSPLTDRFLASILGHLLPDPSARGGGGQGSPLTARLLAGLTSFKRVEVTHPFTNSEFARAYVIPSVPFTSHTNTAGATRRDGDPTNCSLVGGAAWYRYTPPVDIALLASTFGTSYATSLGVFKGTSLSSLTPVPGGCDTNAQGNSQVSFLARVGETYYFQIAGPVGGGDLQFNLEASGQTALLSKSSTGGMPNRSAYDRPAVSADGRYVVFQSYATNLVPSMGRDCTKPTACVGLFLLDRATGTTSLIFSTSYQGAGPNDASGSKTQGYEVGYRQEHRRCCWLQAAAISADGRYVAFDTDSVDPPLPPTATDNQNPADPPKPWRVYVYDRLTERIELASVNSAGRPAHSHPVSNGALVEEAGDWSFIGSYSPSLSADGRYVTFNSDADNLAEFHGAPVPVTPTTDGDPQWRLTSVYVHDRVTGNTELISKDSQGHPLTVDSTACGLRDISWDGRYVVFNPGLGHKFKSTVQIYLRDRVTATTTVISTDRSGKPGEDDSLCPAISGDGNSVAFVSQAPNLSGDPKSLRYVLQWDRRSGTLAVLSASSSSQSVVTGNDQYGNASAGISPIFTSISADGRYVAYSSTADLVPAQSNGKLHSYVHDRLTGATIRVSVSSKGDQGDDVSLVPEISADGSTVVFDSWATNFDTPNPDGIMNMFVHRLVR